MAVPLFNLTPDLIVSRLCLGTMTLGEQNSLAQSSQLLDKAFDSGINFFDSAEMYPVPQRAETQGRSEEYLGRWIRARKIRRDQVVLATKVSGPSGQMTWIRGGPGSLDAWNITEAIDGRWLGNVEDKGFYMRHANSLLRSLEKSERLELHSSGNKLMFRVALVDIRQQNNEVDKLLWLLGNVEDKGFYVSLTRLQSDHIDLYQIHWPDRYVPMFGETEYDPIRSFSSVSIEEQLTALQKAIDAGKIRYVGLSNETPYGLMKFLHVAEHISIRDRIVSLQNSYNLLCRNFDSGLAECCSHERVCLLAYSPLAMGILSGKYHSLDGGPADARLNIFRGRYAEGESRYSLSNPTVKKATDLYVNIAKKYGICPVSLAIAFVLRHPLVASAVFGATKLWQLQEVLGGCKVELTPEIVTEIHRVHSAFPNPCP